MNRLRRILNFHGLGKVGARAMEPGEAAYWVSADLFADTLVLADRLAEKVETYFTFDDGNASDLEIAAPLLARHGRSATFFVLADRIDQPGSLGRADLRALVAEGHRIGSHGAAHVDWRRLDAAGRHREITEARAEIAEAAGVAVTDAGIPFGAYDRKVLQALAAEGFDRVYSSDKGPWINDRAPIPRTSPTADMTLQDIEVILTNQDSAVTQGVRGLKRMLKRVR